MRALQTSHATKHCNALQSNLALAWNQLYITGNCQISLLVCVWVSRAYTFASAEMLGIAAGDLMILCFVLLYLQCQPFNCFRHIVMLFSYQAPKLHVVRSVL